MHEPRSFNELSLARENGFPVLEVYAPLREKRTVTWRGRLKVGHWAHSPVTIVRFYPPQPQRGVSEWSKVVVLKTTGRNKSRGFKSHLLCHMRVSSNGKTTVSKTVNLGSNPCARAT